MSFLSLHKLQRAWMAALLLVLCACSMETETNVNLDKPQVFSGDFYVEFPTADVDEELLKAMGTHYRGFGTGTAYITVTYDPAASSSAASKANAELSRIIGSLEKKGVENISGDVMPVVDQGAKSMTLVSYERLQAVVSADCSRMPGNNGTTVSGIMDYQMGCETDTLFLMQVGRQSDLLGNDAPKANTYTTRTFNKIGPYMFGTNLRPLQGESVGN